MTPECELETRVQAMIYNRGIVATSSRALELAREIIAVCCRKKPERLDIEQARGVFCEWLASRKDNGVPYSILGTPADIATKAAEIFSTVAPDIGHEKPKPPPLPPKPEQVCYRVVKGHCKGSVFWGSQIGLQLVDHSDGFRFDIANCERVEVAT